MHILFLTDNFPPEVNAPASRTFEHCRAWVTAGHQVTVITCAPNFPKGKLFDGYRNKLWQTEERDGIRVIRVWTYIVSNEGFVKRILDYLSFMFSAILAGPFVHRVDVVVGTSPQFFTTCAAYVVSRYKRIPYVFELRDLWPESIKAVGAMRDSILICILEKLELFLYRKAAAVVAVTHSFRRNLAGRGIPEDKIHVVTNGVDLAAFKPTKPDSVFKISLGLEGKFVAGYIGTHGMAHALETLLEAAAILRTRPDGDDYRIVLLGDGANKASLVKKAATLGLGNVVFLDSVPKKEVVLYWSVLDLAIIHLKKTPLFANVIPSKLFESMGMGIPILHGVSGESAELVERENVGIAFEPENSRELAEGIIRLHEETRLYESLRANCLNAAPRYERTRLAMNMLHVLERVVTGEVAARKIG
jgi:glycosyltransferase involved in cell wall biosynthesis